MVSNGTLTLLIHKVHEWKIQKRRIFKSWLFRHKTNTFIALLQQFTHSSPFINTTNDEEVDFRWIT